MPLSLEHIEREMQTTDLSPHTLADYRVYLAALFSLRAAEMQAILSAKPSIWLDIRDGTKSDKSADRVWQDTTHGHRETQLKWDLRRIDKLSSALGSKLRVMEQ